MSRAPSTLLLLALSLVWAGCASSGPREAGRDPNRITAEELATVDVGNLYDAVQRLRPRWLTVGSTRSLGMDTIIGVFQGQSFLGEPSVLRQYPPNAVAGLRYVDSATATATLPRMAGRHYDGAIILELRRESPR